MRLSDRVFALCKNTSSRYLVIPSGNGHYFGELFLREKLMPTKLVPFEREAFPIPVAPEYYLRIRYGEDYMVLPSAENRERHAYFRFDLGNATQSD